MNSLDAHDVAARSAAQGSRLGSAAVEIAGVSGMNCDYSAFLRAKIKMANFSGFDVNASEINPHLKPRATSCAGRYRGAVEQFSHRLGFTRPRPSSKSCG
jgi:hypothetical protein